jgi:hypothetical protein
MQPVPVSPSAPTPLGIDSSAIDCESAGQPAIVGCEAGEESAIAHKARRSS